MASAEDGAPEAKDTSEAENRRAGLNNKPAWMSRGLGVNKEFFGEVKGDLMKPGLTKADLERLEKTKPSGPDPFGDVFRENVKMDDKPEAPESVAESTPEPPPAASSAPAGVLPKAAAMAASMAELPQVAASLESPGAAEVPQTKAKVTPPWRKKEADVPAPKPSPPPFKAPAGAKAKSPAMAAANAKAPAMAAASAKTPAMAAASAKQLPAQPPADVEDKDYDPFSTAPEEEDEEDGEEYDPFSTAPADSPEAAGTGEVLEEVDAWTPGAKAADGLAESKPGDLQTVPVAAAFKGVAAKAFLSGTAAKRPMPFKAPPPKATDVSDVLTGLIAAAQAESAQTLEKIRAMSKQLAAQSKQPPPPPGVPPKAVPGVRRPAPPPPPGGDRVVRPKTGVLPKGAKAGAVKEETSADNAAPPSEAATAAASWLAPGGGGPRRLDRAAALAEEYFVHSAKGDEAAPASKRAKVAAVPAADKGKQVAPAAAPVLSFAPELLEKAPSSIQTCRSLMLFLDKKLEAPLQPAPAVEGPQDLRMRLEKQAEGVGRAACLHETSGWDSRAKRIINIVAAVSSTAGGAALKAFEKQLEETAAKLEKELKERGEGNLESLIEKRSAWARDCMRREWLVWCGRLLRVQEAALLKAAEGGEDSQAAKKDGVSLVGVIEALLTGEGGLSPSCAGG